LPVSGWSINLALNGKRFHFFLAKAENRNIKIIPPRKVIRRVESTRSRRDYLHKKYYTTDFCICTTAAATGRVENSLTLFGLPFQLLIIGEGELSFVLLGNVLFTISLSFASWQSLRRVDRDVCGAEVSQN